MPAEHKLDREPSVRTNMIEVVVWDLSVRGGVFGRGVWFPGPGV